MKTLLAIINEPLIPEEFLRYSFRMANDLNMNLHLSYILNSSVYPLDPGITGAATQLLESRLQNERETVITQLKERITDLQNEMSLDILVEYSAEPGTADMLVNQYVDEKMIEMVVLYGNDKSGVWTLGSDNMDIVLNVSCPVWIIPPGSTYYRYEKIVYATNYNQADIKTLKELINLTSKFSPQITALHVADSLDVEEEIAKEGFRDAIIKETLYDNIYIETLIEKDDEDLGETINDFAISKNANLIVVLRENRNFLERLFRSSSTKKIVKEAQLPVLVFQEKS